MQERNTGIEPVFIQPCRNREKSEMEKETGYEEFGKGGEIEGDRDERR